MADRTCKEPSEKQKATRARWIANGKLNWDKGRVESALVTLSALALKYKQDGYLSYHIRAIRLMMSSKIRSEQDKLILNKENSNG